jgi:hypothetical protein
MMLFIPAFNTRNIQGIIQDQNVDIYSYRQFCVLWRVNLVKSTNISDNRFSSIVHTDIPVVQSILKQHGFMFTVHQIDQTLEFDEESYFRLLLCGIHTTTLMYKSK